MSSAATILIAARNASSTIEKALTSACAHGDYDLVLIDDFSADDTVLRARRIAGNRLKVIRPTIHQSLGFTRETGLDAVETPFGMWLDADDELLPGRLARMIEAMDSEKSDFACDAVELRNGLTGEFIRHLAIPEFIKNHHPLARLFERNFLPAPGAIGFRTNAARFLGYDAQLHGAEDYDFLLRAIAAGSKFSLLASTGYRQFAYAQSLSRSMENQRKMCQAALAKHSYDAVRALYAKAGYENRIALWALISIAMFRVDYPAVLRYLREAEEAMREPETVLEPLGPYPYPESWLLAFFKGTVLLLMDKATEALSILERQHAQLPTAAGCNNLGIAKWHTGDKSTAASLFQQSLRLFPGYLDAKKNLASPFPSFITTHPLRIDPARTDYAAV